MTALEFQEKSTDSTNVNLIIEVFELAWNVFQCVILFKLTQLPYKLYREARPASDSFERQLQEQHNQQLAENAVNEPRILSERKKTKVKRGLTLTLKHLQRPTRETDVRVVEECSICLIDFDVNSDE